MNPKSVGDPSQDKPQANADDETVMIYQDFVLDPETKVKEVLDESNIEVSSWSCFNLMWHWTSTIIKSCTFSLFKIIPGGRLCAV